MVRQGRLYRWRFLGAGLLFGLAIGAWFGSRWLVAEPGSPENVFARIRIGMGKDEAVAVLRTYHPNNIDTIYAEGTTKEGRGWTGTKLYGPSFEDLPPAQEIAHCELRVSDENGRDVEVVLGPGGIVLGKRLTPGVWQYRLDSGCVALGHAKHDLLSGSWWNDQRHKTYRSLVRNRQYVAPCLATGLLLASVWILRRRIARCWLSQAQTKEPSRPNKSNFQTGHTINGSS